MGLRRRRTQGLRAWGGRGGGVAGRLVGVVQPLLGGGPLPVRIRAWDGSEVGPKAAPLLLIRSRRALRRLVWRPGELGLAQAYVTGEIDVPGGVDDLTDGLRRIWHVAQSGPGGAVRLTPRQKVGALRTVARVGALGPPPKAPVTQARLRGGRHTTARDRAAIGHHYDLASEFYALQLDPSMAYSCAYYGDADATLEQAQRAKLDLVCRKLGLEPGMRLLDVGCGWGSLALHAAEHYGAQVVAVTISPSQVELVTERIAERGLAGRVELRLQDYRDLTEQDVDAVASIEMGEHVGEDHYPTYAATMFGALKPGGRLLMQQMSRRLDAAPGGGAFIERFIAPDMHMRPLSATLGHLEAAGFEVRDVHALREHYVRTVADWLAAYESRYDEAVRLVGQEWARAWRLYLAGGSLAFEQGRMGVDQVLATRPLPSGHSGLPATPTWHGE